MARPRGNIATEGAHANANASTHGPARTRARRRRRRRTHKRKHEHAHAHTHGRARARAHTHTQHPTQATIPPVANSPWHFIPKPVGGSSPKYVGSRKPPIPVMIPLLAGTPAAATPEHALRKLRNMRSANSGKGAPQTPETVFRETVRRRARANPKKTKGNMQRHRSLPRQHTRCVLHDGRTRPQGRQLRCPPRRSLPAPRAQRKDRPWHRRAPSSAPRGRLHA